MVSLIEANMNINLPTDSKGVHKLYQTISDIFSPAATYMKGISDRLKISNDEKIVKRIESIDDPVLQMMYQQEKYKLTNISKIASLSEQELQATPEDNVSDTPVSSTWIYEFFENAGKISDEEVQLVWSKILTGEIKEPGTFSLRTLQTIFYSSKEELQLFYNSTKFMFCGFHLIKEHTRMPYSEPKFADYTKLQWAGFLGTQHCADGVIIDKDEFINFGSKFVKARLKEKDKPVELKLPGFSLTPVGEDLFKIGAAEPTKEMLKYYKKLIESEYKMIEIVIN